MPSHTAKLPLHLGLRRGDLVEVRSEQEILSTLDHNASLDSLPFMPEMLQHCGKRFRVFHRADKACDTITRSGLNRRMMNAVYLENLRCDGSGHDRCQAACLIFWKEAWLKRVPESGVGGEPAGSFADPEDLGVLSSPDSVVWRGAQTSGYSAKSCTYSCQVTRMSEATSELSSSDPRQYLRDLWYGNASFAELLRALGIAIFNKIQRLRKGAEHPYLYGRGGSEPPAGLNLQPGELVQINTKEEILATVDGALRNRGLTFDSEMLRYCGGTFRVLKRVERIINENTGKMMKLPPDCIILDGVVCVGEFHGFCRRSIYPYWRELWLKRPTGASQPATANVSLADEGGSSKSQLNVLAHCSRA